MSDQEIEWFSEPAEHDIWIVSVVMKLGGEVVATVAIPSVLTWAQMEVPLQAFDPAIIDAIINPDTSLLRNPTMCVTGQVGVDTSGRVSIGPPFKWVGNTPLRLPNGDPASPLIVGGLANRRMRRNHKLG